MGGRQAKPLSTGETVATSADHPEPFNAVEFVRLDRPNYVAEVGKKGDDYIYHFYPKKVDEGFEDKMGDAFLAVFNSNDQVEAGFTDELNSWAVRVRGFAHHLWGDDLAIRVLDKLDSLLE